MKLRTSFYVQCWQSVAITIVLTVVPETSFCQNVTFKVAPNVLVAKETHTKLFIEPHIISDPKDANKLLAASVVFDSAFKSADVLAIFSSVDGGKSWKRQDLPCIECADPWVSITNRGLAFATALGDHPRLPKLSSQLIAYSSLDGGLNWGETPQSFGANHDRSRSLAAPDGTLYVLSGKVLLDGDKKNRNAVFLGKAEPGRTFIKTMPIIYPSNMGLNSDGLAALSDGSLLITYDDGVRRMNGTFRGIGLLKGRRSWALVTKDRGESFSMPLFLTENCFRTPAFLAVDSSQGPDKDRLYYLCPGQNERELILNYSADKGEEWTQASVEAASDKDRARLIPQIAVNKDGVVGVAWMDRRDDTSGKCYAPYFAASVDGGKIFSKPTRISTALSCPKLDQMGGTGRRWPVGGDYFGLTATADGKFHLLWPDARSGFFELWTTNVSVVVSK